MSFTVAGMFMLCQSVMKLREAEAREEKKLGTKSFSAANLISKYGFSVILETKLKRNLTNTRSSCHSALPKIQSYQTAQFLKVCKCVFPILSL